ncbi:MAG: YDG domain-containing protein [Bacteroidales bacterium]
MMSVSLLPASGTFSMASVRTDIPVTTSMGLTGTDAGNYTLTQPTD